MVGYIAEKLGVTISFDEEEYIATFTSDGEPAVEKSEIIDIYLRLATDDLKIKPELKAEIKNYFDQAGPKT